MNSVHHNKTIHDNVAATQRQRLQARPRIIAQPSWVGAVPIEPYHSFLSLYITLTLGHQFIYPFNLTNKLLHAISHAFPFSPSTLHTMVKTKPHKLQPDRQPYSLSWPEQWSHTAIDCGCDRVLFLITYRAIK